MLPKAVISPVQVKLPLASTLHLLLPLLKYKAPEVTVIVQPFTTKEVAAVTVLAAIGTVDLLKFPEW